MDDLANATGGVVKTTSSTSAEIAQAIVSGLKELSFELTAVPVGCAPLDVTFDPPSYAEVPGGSSREFVETISVPASVTPDQLPRDGVVRCSVEFRANDAVIGAQQLAIRVPVAIEIPIDIKPGSCPNPLGTGDSGVVPIAILGTADFSVRQVDVSSIQLAGLPALRDSYSDVSTPFVPFVGKVSQYDCNRAGPDGYLDLTLKFDAQRLVQALGPVTNGEVRVLELTGKLLDGTPIRGEDVMIIRMP